MGATGPPRHQLSIPNVSFYPSFYLHIPHPISRKKGTFTHSLLLIDTDIPKGKKGTGKAQEYVASTYQAIPGLVLS